MHKRNAVLHESVVPVRLHLRTLAAGDLQHDRSAVDRTFRKVTVEAHGSFDRDRRAQPFTADRSQVDGDCRGMEIWSGSHTKEPAEEAVQFTCKLLPLSQP